MKIPLTVQSKKSMFDGKILLESINIEILDKLLNPINSNLLKSYDTITCNDIYTNEYVSKTYSNEREQLLKYKNNIKFNKGFVRYDKTRELGGFGRVFPYQSLGLFSFRKQIRGALAKNLYIDVDISNAHPSLLLQIAQSNELECKYLAKYVNNREKYLNLVATTYDVSQDTAKNLFIILLYLGSFSKWKKVHKIESDTELSFITHLKEELTNIGKVMLTNNKTLVDLITKKQLKLKKKNIVSSTMSFILQEWECQIIETVYEYCTDKTIINNDAVLCCDGVMIKENKYYDGLLNEFSTLIYDKLGFSLTFTQKQLNTEIYNDLV